MADRQSIESIIDLSHSYLSKEEQEVNSLLVKYREAFSLRDEIGTSPNIEVELQVIDISTFFIMPFHVRKQDKPIIDKEMQRWVNAGILKQDMPSYSFPIVLIARKNPSSTRIITDFRFLNSRQ